MNGNLITNDLFSKILLPPALEEEEKDLYIVSGYASSAMAFHHAQKLKERKCNVNIKLIIGMTARDGISEANHRGFQELMEQDLSGSFECSYLINQPPVHAKVYSWIQNKTPIKGFTGSVNYSQQAFIGKSQKEIATECNPVHAYEYFQSLIDNSICCNHQDASQVINLYTDNRENQSTKTEIEKEVNQPKKTLLPEGLDHINISLINRFGEISKKSGLNWGQRPNREPNQAYIPLKSDVYKTNFFPPVSQHFTIHTDDGKILICTRAQENGKAIETPHNNSLIGEYFRFRLDVPNGELVTMDHLLSYGRANVDFYKIDEENYHMNFEVIKDH